LFGAGEPNNPAMGYPCHFHDLQVNTSTYYKYALGLIYLEYLDNTSPFSRSFTSFRPNGNITRANTLKVLLESFNQDEYATGANQPPFNDILKRHGNLTS
jgi:hypothetical protein